MKDEHYMDEWNGKLELAFFWVVDDLSCFRIYCLCCLIGRISDDTLLRIT
jgi:hypothetical protein